MKNSFVSLACGLLFGAGLVLSGMTDPKKVQAFLHFTDPTLAVVMGAAVPVCAIFYAVARRRARSSPVEKRPIDARLVTGAAVFGIGWGLVGACPGPAVVSLGAGAGWSIVFVLAMIVGARLESRPRSAVSGQLSAVGRPRHAQKVP
jgi:uncharacterized membrane protein YedE/YeeE